MINTKVGFKITLLLLLMTSFLFAGKEIYLPNFFKQQGIDFESPSAQWSRSRMDSTANWIILWESGFGSDPSSNVAPYKVNMSQLKEGLEKSYAMNLNTMKMVVKGSSNTDRYKMIAFIKYTETWGAYGWGYDDVIGSLELNPAAANIPVVVAHETGHTFQYQVACDVPEGGFRYGLGPNADGENGFWEQAAQWAAFKVYPEEQFRTHDFDGYVTQNHLHILHEEPRYANYFLPDYWAYKRGIEFMGRLWRESRRPEDPVDAYKRLFNVSQSEFNEEIFEHAARLTTWDLPAIKTLGANFINKRAQVKMNKTSDNFWIVDRSVTIENYGYNSIKLNTPTNETSVSVQFQGKAGESGYRALNIDKGGWRYGFVALLSNGTRVYSDMASLDYAGKNPEGTLTFTVPAGCSNLWLVVSGAPQEHWHHQWDDDDTNDEQWPYQVKFSNTNLLGEANSSDPVVDVKTTTVQLAFDVKMTPKSDYEPVIIPLKAASIASAFGLTESELGSKIGKEVAYYGVNPDGSFNQTSTAVDPGHWYNKDGQTIAYGNDARIYSEIDVTALTAKIGQYPSLSANGDIYTIRQALVYQKSPTEKVQVHLTFSVSIEGTSKIKQWVNRPILHQGELPILSSETQQLLNEGHATLGSFNIQGKKMASTQNVSSWEDLGITKNGVYRIVLFENNKIKATQSISYIAGRH